MTLRYASFDGEGNKIEESLLDDKVCDCCQTDAAMTSKGPIIVYRNRSDEETSEDERMNHLEAQECIRKKFMASAASLGARASASILLQHFTKALRDS